MVTIEGCRPVYIRLIAAIPATQSTIKHIRKTETFQKSTNKVSNVCHHAFLRAKQVYMCPKKYTEIT